MLVEKMQAVERVFLNRNGFDGITKSKDSTDKKLLFTVPITLVHKISTLLSEIESDIPEMQADIELNSLEDAFIKIIESESEKDQHVRKSQLSV